MRSIGDIRRLEDLLNVRLGLDAHVFLSESFRLLLEVGVLLWRVAVSLGTSTAACVLQSNLDRSCERAD